MINLDDQKVSQIFEEKIDNKTILTTIISRDYVTNDVSYIYYFGELENVLEDDIILVYGIPLGNSYYENTMGGETGCSVFLASYINDYYGLEDFISVASQEFDGSELPEDQFYKYYRDLYKGWLSGDKTYSFIKWNAKSKTFYHINEPYYN